MSGQFVRLETTVRRVPLALHFLDLARAVAVTDDLDVQAWQLGATGPVFWAGRSPLSGIYGFRSLPGLRPFEVGERPVSDWCGEPGPGSPPAAAEELPDLGDLLDGDLAVDGPPPNFAVTVVDRRRRFLPLLMLMCLPKKRLVEVPLFSSSACPTPTGQAALRGQVWDRVADAPAAWALVTAQPDIGAGYAPSYAALADEKGVFTLFMPYASPMPPLVGSPPYGTLDLDELTWSVTIEVFFEPARQRTAARPEGMTTLLPPDIRSILYQRPALVVDRAGSIPVTTLNRALRFGQELNVYTEDLLPPRQFRLLVDPA